MKWTYEKCKEEALKYETRTEFAKKSGSAKNSAIRNGWLDEICSHMISPQKPSGYWTKERCQNEALKCNSRWEFNKSNYSAYNSALKNGWLDEICSHMTKKLRNYWNKKTCKKEALKYKNRKEFAINSSQAYKVALEKNWLNNYQHFKPKIEYTKDYCSNITKKYTILKMFISENQYLYQVILKNEWCDLFSHFITHGNLHKRCIYVYEFNDKSAYIGLTYNINIRNNQHMKKGPVYKHIIKTKYTPKIKKLTDYIEVDVAKIKEGEYANKYKNKGWKILNKSKTGGTGGSIIKWTYEKCKKEALKYKNRTEYLKNSTSYYAASKNGWLQEICKHMKKYEKLNK